MQKVVGVLLLVGVVYYGVAMAAYAFAHPEKTQTELVLEIGKAMTWDWED